MNKLFAFVLLMFALPAHAVTGPQELIKQTADSVIAEIKANSERYKNDPQELHKLINDLVLPHFDFPAMTDLALGKYKDDANIRQKKLLVNEFRALLVRTYSSALLEYSGEELIYLPMDGIEEDGRVIVKTEIDQGGGFPIPINYTLRLGADGWKVFDISVDEVSLVTNYRSSFARAIRKNGIDGLIKNLQERNSE